MRAFWPPLIFIPLSPILVSTPSFSSHISCSRQHKPIILLNFSSSYGLPKSILFLSVSDIMKGSCSTYQTSPITLSSPCLASSSFIIVQRRVVLPEPTGPITARKSLLSSFKVTLIKFCVG